MPGFFQVNIEMPIAAHRDHDGTYQQWGDHGHHYYYGPGTGVTKEQAYAAAARQAAAAHADGYRGK